MKPIIALAASAPFLLLAGVGHAASFSFDDPNCSSFTLSGNTLSCVSATAPTTPPDCSVVFTPTTAAVGSPVTISASCSPAATSYAWTGSPGSPAVTGQSTTVTFSAEGTYTYTVTGTNANGTDPTPGTNSITISAGTPTGGGGEGGGGGGGGACPTGYAVPSGTTIIDLGTKDYYANKDFDTVFDNPGSTFDSAVGGAETKALKFTNAKSLAGWISGTAGNFGAGYKDWSLSVCPGDFNATLPAACLKLKRSSVNMYYSTDGSQGCTIPVNTAVYLNIRSSVTGTPAGFVLQNVQQSALPQ